MENKKPEEQEQLRADLQDFYHRRSYLLDENRPEAVAKRHAKNQRTARENIADLCDADSFLEYGSLLIAAQRGRKPVQQLIEETPADGLVAGIGSVNGASFDQEKAQCLVMSYDYTVMAGTQGGFNHKKTDRMLGIAAASALPVIFFLEGGGGRPGDVDFAPISVGGLDLMTFVEFARLSGQVPRIAIVAGNCFAGNAAIAGCADVIIATENTSIGMGGPAMIEGGGLGSFAPEEVGPAAVQTANGVIDILVKDEQEAVGAAKKYLAYFQGDLKAWSCADQLKLRDLIPEERRWAYDIRKVITTMADKDSVLELRSEWGKNMITALIRIEGKPLGLIANNPRHLGGAIDGDASDKAARFMQLCDAFGLPILSLCDAPGFMVGPDYEKKGMVRHASRLFVVGASLRVPIFTIVLRRGYGLGAMAMAGGSFKRAAFTISWPTGEFGAMGLEGAVKLGFRKELESVADETEREALYNKILKKAYEQGKATNTASVMEIDEVIDPKDSRLWVSRFLNKPSLKENNIKTSRYIDCW